MDIKGHKKRLRENIKSSLQLTEEQRKQNSLILTNKITSLPLFKECSTFLAFVSTKGEIEIESIIDLALKENKEVGLPVVDKEMLDFYKIDLHWQDNLVEGKWGLKEVNKELYQKLDAFKEPLLILVPALAFSHSKVRLGRGKGFYDRFLSTLKVDFTTVGVCYDYQVLATLPAEKHDIKVDYVVTPTISI